MKLPRRRGRAKNSDRSTAGAIAADALTQLALWSSATLAGMVTGLLLAREPFFRKLIARVGGSERPEDEPDPQETLPMLANAVIGSSKALIAEVFGPPRAAVLHGPPAAEGVLSFWEASVWYYPLPRRGPVAMAIAFDEGIALRVEFFQTPHKLATAI